MYFFRVDSGLEIGSGHLMRCLTLAKKIPDEVAFICKKHEGNLNHIITEQGFKLIELELAEGEVTGVAHGKWLGGDIESEISQLKDITSTDDTIIIDHYAIDERYHKKLRAFVGRVIQIDDLADRKHDCDILIDQNLYVDAETRYDGLVSDDCIKLLGAKYAILRDEFINAKPRLREDVKNIFIFMGGVDKDNLTCEIINNYDFSLYEVKVLVGVNNPNKAEVQTLCANNNLEYIEGSNEVSELMLWADLAIGAGGTTTYERACLGLPCLTYTIADNQKQLTTDSIELGIALKPNTKIEDINIKKISENCLTICDGKGVYRITKKLGFKPTLIKATPEHSKSIWELRNQESVRLNSHNTDIIQWEVHENWFKNSLINKNRDIFVYELGKENIGVLRYDYNGDSALISIFLNDKFSGLGYGTAIIEEGELWVKENRKQVKKVIAEILPHNEASKKLFTKLGLVKQSEEYMKEL